jgi:hypothetical protein
MAMLPTIMIQGELRLPAAFLQGQEMDVIERRLYKYGMLPVQARARRWRMDAENSGGYILQYTLELYALTEE